MVGDQIDAPFPHPLGGLSVQEAAVLDRVHAGLQSVRDRRDRVGVGCYLAACLVGLFDPSPHLLDSKLRRARLFGTTVYPPRGHELDTACPTL